MKSGLLALSALGAIALASTSNAASAQEQPAAGTTRDFQVPAQPLSQSIVAVASTANIQVLYSDELPPGLRAPALSGRMSVDEALARLLSGTGYTFRYTQPGVITIIAAASSGSPDGERVLGAVRVQGSQGGASALPGSSPVNGINGSRDVTATEGTGSYTSNALTVGSKVAESIKDTAMAVSVITNQRLQDQNLTDINSVLKNAPGISFSDSNGSAYNFYSRGFTITQYSFDGGVPINTTGGYYRPLMDMSLYDHVEIVRGATGTFNAYGDPGGVVNLVRKKPLDHSQMLFEFQLGSWQNHRVSADITGPLGFDGKLRGRLIATHQDNKFFYKVAEQNTNLIAGVLEYDVTPTTLATVGLNYQVSTGNNTWVGLPRYQDGRPLDLPRSTFLGFDWARYSTSNLEAYAQIDQKIGRNWNFRSKITDTYQFGDILAGSLLGTINPYDYTGSFARVTNASRYKPHNILAEVTLDGNFNILGHEQKFVLGTNISFNDDKGGLGYNGYHFVGTPIRRSAFIDNVDIFHYNPYGQPIDYDHVGVSTVMKYSDSLYINNYLSADLTPISRLHISTSIRYSMYRNRDFGVSICAPIQAYLNQCTLGQYNIFGSYLQHYKGEAFSWPPTTQWRFDLTKNMTAYAAYTDIYADQSSFKTKDGKPLGPVTGGNLEGGLKWLSPSQKLNVTISAYYTTKRNWAQLDAAYCRPPSGSAPSNCTDSTGAPPGGVENVSHCCYIQDPNGHEISYGVDFELSGEIRRGWQLAASYSYNNNYVRHSYAFDGTKNALQAYAPRHLYKLWSTYTFPGGSKLEGSSIGFGFSGQSKTRVHDGYCAAYVAAPTPTNPDAQQCNDFRDVFFSDPGHVVFSGSIGYKINNILRMDLNLENLLDKKYFQTVGGLANGNWYGPPRSFSVALRGKW